MSLIRIALVAEDRFITFSELSAVNAAFQEQLMRDFGPVWGIQATISPFESLEAVPLGTWPIVVTESIPSGNEGAQEDLYGHPIAFIDHRHERLRWSLMASHACLEMLADPYGNRTVPAQSPKKGQGMVEFLVETCDPCKDGMYAYWINGIAVSDFYTPNFFDPIPSRNIRYSFTNSIKEPRSVLRNGYLSWRDPLTNHWFQQTWFDGPKPRSVDLGEIDPAPSPSCRTRINRFTKAYSDVSLTLNSHMEMQHMVQPTGMSKAQAWRTQIKQFRN